MAEVQHNFSDGASYENFMGRWSRAVGRVFLDWVAPPSGLRWLEVGCGTGIFTKLAVDTCSPAEMFAIDPAEAQINHAVRELSTRQAHFRVADALVLPFANAEFDVVVSALVINFIPDRPRALTEMRRVAREEGIVAGYVWDFPAELSPSWPLRVGMRKFGAAAPDAPGAEDSSLGALDLLLRQAGFKEIDVRTIEVTQSYSSFEEFWQAQTPSYSPTAKVIAALTQGECQELKDTVLAGLPVGSDGRIEYSASANAIKARVPR